MGPADTAHIPRTIDAYGGGGFRVSGAIHRGSIIILPDRVVPWPVSDAAALTRESLAAVVAAVPLVEILLIGCGPRVAFIPPALRQALRESGLVVDAMDTGAACRTFNVLRAEERRVAAALVAVG
jgi:uncharacterized protein